MLEDIELTVREEACRVAGTELERIAGGDAGRAASYETRSTAIVFAEELLDFEVEEAEGSRERCWKNRARGHGFSHSGDWA